jgi:hypothetical protein
MAPQIARLAAPLAGCTRQQTAAPFARLALTALRFNRGAFDCRQLDRICERRGVSDRLCRHDENGGASCLRRSTRLSP